MRPIEQAIAAQRAGKLSDAEALYRQILARDARDFDALHMLGIIHAQREQYKEAERLIGAAVAVDRKVPQCLHNYGNVLSKLMRFEEAVGIYNEALALAPKYAPLYSDRGNAQKELGQYQESLASYDKALSLNPNFPQAYYNRGAALLKLHRDRDALLSHERALMLKPDYALAHGGRGDILREQGRLAEALAAYCRAVELDPNDGVLYLGLSESKTFTPNDPHLASMESLAAKTTGVPMLGRMYLDFALGKAFSDLKDHRRSFEYLLAANAAKRTTINYDEQAELKQIDRTAQVFSADLMREKAGGGDPSRRPIFVLGMPRSGTTLVEQILASHPAVHGAGERTWLWDAVTAVKGVRGGPSALPYPDVVPSLDRTALTAIGANYVKLLSGLAPKAERVTDKLPSNFLLAGLIHMTLPNAVIIHCVRDPIDTCLSCFSRLFASGQNYSYDLRELGRYYVRYQRLMEHWNRVLPPRRMLDVRYEDVVADLEGQARRMLEHCGLDWDERCLAFHKTERPVRTASVTQVRQPIYASSVGRWRVYEDALGPLLSELGAG